VGDSPIKTSSRQPKNSNLVFSNHLSVTKRGVMKTAIVNPIWFEKDEDVRSGLSEWLEGPEFDEHPVLTRRKSLFHSRTKNFHSNDWLLLELITAHSAGPGDSSPSEVIENDFCAIVAKEIPEQARRDAFFQHVKTLRHIGLIDQ
jgi:hypothetical protein